MPPNHYTIMLDFENSLYYFDLASVFSINDPKSEIFKDFIKGGLSEIECEKLRRCNKIFIIIFIILFGLLSIQFLKSMIKPGKKGRTVFGKDDDENYGNTDGGMTWVIVKKNFWSLYKRNDLEVIND